MYASSTGGHGTGKEQIRTEKQENFRRSDVLTDSEHMWFRFGNTEVRCKLV